MKSNLNPLLVHSTRGTSFLRMKLSFRLQILGGFLTVLFALGGLMYFAIQSNKSYLDNTRKIISYNQALYHIEQVRSWGMEMESSQRGFTITYDSTFLDPYIRSASMIETNIHNLGLLTRSLLDDDPTPQLRKLARRKKDSTQRIIMARHHSFDSARAVIGSYAGEHITDSIRLVADMAEAKITSALLDLRRKREDEMDNSQMQVAATLLTTAMVLVILFGLIDYNQQKRLRAEKTLEEALREKNSLYQQAPCGYFTLDKDLQFLKVNDTFLGFVRFTRQQMLNDMKLTDILSAESAEILTTTLNDRTDEGLRTVDLDLVTADGQLFCVTASLLAFQHANREIRFSVIDCSEKRKAEQRIKELNTELEDFSYSVSHDLRSPLRVISGYAHMLKEDYQDSLNKEAHGIIDVIIRNAQKMGQLIDDLLSFARLTRAEVRKQPVDFQEMVSSAFSEISEALPLNAPQLKIGPMLPVQSDVLLMKQVWLNLLSNAVKYSSQKDQPVIEVGSYEQDQSVCYFVRDNGVGFNMVYADQLFKVFERLHRDDEFSGTGVGLALVKKIITRQGGNVWAESSPGKGAVFYFSLPNH